jgi:hypothetical protein
VLAHASDTISPSSSNSLIRESPLTTFILPATE